MRYQAVGFDWGGVLNGRPGKYFGQQVSGLLGVSHQKYLETYFKHYKKVNRGEVSWEELWTLVLTDLGQPDKVQQVVALGQTANAHSPNQDVLGLVDSLRSHGYKVGLLSNNTHEKAKLMRETGLDKHFDAFQISSETGLVKPEPEAFSHLAKELGVELKKLVYIDDSENSLKTADECGFTPILFDSYKQLIGELVKLGIKF